MGDLLTDSLNSSAGLLAEVLLKKLRTQSCGEMPVEMRARFEKLIRAEGRFGELARVRLAAEISFLFEQAPEWTEQNVVPLFDWSSPGALAAWSARKYSNYIGSPTLVGLMKKPFLALFKRHDVSEDDLRTFSDWIAAMMLANQSDSTNYPITSIEARTALRQAGTKVLPSVGHRLAVEMEKAKSEEKIAKWRNVVGPVFQGIWPLDVDLQTSASTFKLVQILRASGNAFPEAAEVIIPFVRPEDPNRHTSIHSISEACDVLYSSSPQKMLDLVFAVVGDRPARSIYGFSKTLDRIRSHDSKLADTNKFQKLMNFASVH